MKPENILVCVDSNTNEVTNIKICDFGLSRILPPGQFMYESCGTPEYVAPEILYKKGYKNTVDMWCAGIIFYVIACKKFPFKDKDRSKLFEDIKTK